MVDRNLQISDVCKVFGPFVRYNVVIQLSEQEPTTVAHSLSNAFTILMNSSAKQSIAARKPHHDKKPERTNKDKLYNAIITFIE